ncbi:FKBP-type peptidyl-prolyl cis-trans isomerase [Streptomyces sp. S6]
MSIEKPEIDFPEGQPPADLEIKDIWEGDGEVAQAGQMVTVHYVGVTFATGEEFDASWNRGSAFKFPLGAGRVIQGWDKGVEGMKVGGRRQLTIPPHLGYGDQSPTPAIPAGSTLIFVVDLIAV